MVAGFPQKSRGSLILSHPGIDYGGDQVWAQSIILAGYVKLYAPTVAVYHSHDYGPEETLARSTTEGAFFYRHFGYKLGDGSAEQLEQRIAAEQAQFRRKAELTAMPAPEVEKRLANIAAKHRGWRAGLLAAASRGSRAAVCTEPALRRRC